jgi:hypothetical protein
MKKRLNVMGIAPLSCACVLFAALALVCASCTGSYTDPNVGGGDGGGSSAVLAGTTWSYIDVPTAGLQTLSFKDASTFQGSTNGTVKTSGAYTLSIVVVSMKDSTETKTGTLNSASDPTKIALVNSGGVTFIKVDGGGGGGIKPTTLSSGVAATTASAKLDAIIAYSGTPSALRANAQTLKANWSIYSSSSGYYYNAWSTYGPGVIASINAMIDLIP